MSDSLQPMDYSLPGSSIQSSPGKNAEVGGHSLLQGIFPARGLNPGLLYCRWIHYHLSHQGSPRSLCKINIDSGVAHNLSHIPQAHNPTHATSPK